MKRKHEAQDCERCEGLGKRLSRGSRGGKKLFMVNCAACGGVGRVAVKPKTSAPAPAISADKSKKPGNRLTDDQKIAKDTIEERAGFFGCPGKVTGIRKGPVITLYEFEPGKITRVKRLQNLQEDLALALSVDAVMVRRIPGKNIIGIEMSNPEGDRRNVSFRESLQYIKEAKRDGMELPLNLGTDPFGVPVVDDLAAMPHLLMAGSTGSGKSVSLNCIVSSLLTVCSPHELQFYMIDPKGVELVHYNGIPHMKEPMVTSPHYAKHMLENLVRVMRRRLTDLTLAGVRDIRELNLLKKGKGEDTIPRIVLVVDELGDLMLQDRREFTALFAEISQIARATGIHMVCATQRPSVDVLSGKIKVNFPGRMSFKVTSAVDSKTIIQRKGAEGLLGRGDMLYLSPTRATCIRIHAPWVPLEDVKELARKIRVIEEARIAEELRKQAEEERKRVEEARKKAEEERKRVEEERKKAEREAKKAGFEAARESSVSAEPDGASAWNGEIDIVWSHEPKKEVK